VTGWATTAELAGPLLHDALATCASFGTDRPDIQGQRLVEVITWLLAVPVATAQLNRTPVPDIGAANVLVWIGPEPPDGNGLKLRSGTPLEGDSHVAIDAHLAPLVEAVHRHTKRPEAALKRAVKDRYDAAIAWVAQLTDQPDRAFELLAHRAELRLLDLGTHELLLHVREGCCLYYRTPANVKCFSCPLLDDDARRRLVAGGG
jgi:hypothetical protein